MKRIDKALEQQIDLNKTKNILYAQLDQVIEIDPGFLAALEELLAGDVDTFQESALQDAISFASRMLLQRLYSLNQFLQIDKRDVKRLELIYQHTWQRIVETQNIEKTLRECHYPELTDWIANLYPRSFLKPLRASPTIGRVVCEEYSPQLQLELLRIDQRTVKQPWLDLGCGRKAGLVRHLRASQIEAYGIDRQIGRKAHFLRQIDWFDYSFEPDSWGTITSNMAFTNHLLYAYRHDPAQLKLYGRKFKEIIESLMIAGSFYYAPSAPFVERGLRTDLYRVERIKVVKEISMTRITKI